MFNPLNDAIIRFVRRTGDFLPNLFGGIVIIIAGILISKFVKQLLLTLFSFFKISTLLQKTRLVQKTEVEMWEQVIAEILRWTIIVIFLIPALEAWGLSQATVVLNQFLIYLPNVIISVIIMFVGMIVSNLTADLVRQGFKTLGQTSAATFAYFAKSAILFFTILVVMNQLGVAQDLIRILFTGIVAMFALAGGLAFGLGGKEVAKELLDDLKKKLKQP